MVKAGFRILYWPKCKTIFLYVNYVTLGEGEYMYYILGLDNFLLFITAHILF